MRNAAPSKMPRIPPSIDMPPSYSFATIRRSKTDKPRAKSSKLIAVDIFSSRLCVLILIPVVDLAAGVARCSSSRASLTYKGMRKPEFQKIRRIKTALFIRSAFGAFQNLLNPGSVSRSRRRDVPVSLVFFIPIRLAAHIMEHTSLWNGTAVC
jgi:hypothetical protein